MEQAAMVEPLAVAFRAVSRALVKAGDSVAVIGGGTIGLLCAAVARARGASPTFLAAKYPHQAGKAAELGVTRPLLAAEGDPREAILGQTGGRGVDAAIDTVAVGTSLSTAISVVARKGRLVEVGGASRPLLAALYPLVSREIQMTGSSCYAVTEGRRDFEWAMDLIAEGKVNVCTLITHTFPLARVAEAFRTAADKKTGSIKVMVSMEP
jgi:threonine dehydrogenase-like Zn-dependent dehydrogenase